ncbi:hypothetical protein [Bacillus cereus group sp. MYBK35-2]|uniref:hypothetical protein n=1 Tax=unclassified Bacillus cereus group TaxID=2750818 RepID=UPI0029F271EA|nr:hypothetical protein [Bacillus cereus]MDA2318263.1 hypothetical protein [Bacillus cereus]MDA2503329.1 hypothetical protein [Bacillus cereus]
MNQKFVETEEFNEIKQLNKSRRRPSKGKKGRYESKATRDIEKSKIGKLKEDTCKPKLVENEMKKRITEEAQVIGNKPVEERNMDTLFNKAKQLEKIIMSKNQLINEFHKNNKLIYKENENLTQVNIQLKQELISQIKCREEELNQFLELRQTHADIESRYEKIEKRFNALERKYNSLSKSRLGKLTLGYWKLMNRLKGGQK